MNKNSFTFSPSDWIPFRDQKVLEYCRNIKREEMETLPHPNPEYKVRVVPHPQSAITAELVNRLWKSDVEDKKIVIIFPNPWKNVYNAVAEICNAYHISARNLHAFCMDEWADTGGTVAPISYTPSLGGAFLREFYMRFQPELRPPLEQIHYYTNENIEHYSELIEEAGDGCADLAVSATGWIGHTAFVDPGSKAFAADSLEEFLKLGTRFVDNRRLTIIQNCMAPMFGGSGDLAYTPCCSVSVGPRDIYQARDHLERHDLGYFGNSGYSSWERMISRLELYGPVTKDVPASLFQLTKGTVFVSEDIARPIEKLDLIAY